MPLLRVGVQEEVHLSIRVKNQGEDAHEATLEVLLPKALPLINTEVRRAALKETSYSAVRSFIVRAGYISTVWQLWPFRLRTISKQFVL